MPFQVSGGVVSPVPTSCASRSVPAVCRMAVVSRTRHRNPVLLSRAFSRAMRPSVMWLIVRSPQGWCCTETGDCFELTQATCVAFGGTYGGDGSTCADSDACDDTSDCLGDTTGDGVVNVDDVLDVLANYGSDGSSGDADGDNDVDVDDVLLVINGWGNC